MQFTFLNAAGTVLFVRDDFEQGGWTQEEYSIDLTFPFVSGKVILRGMRVCFRDPATNNLEVFEVRNVQNIEPDHYQQIKAEHIALSELSDEHINTTEITDKTAAQALTTALTGTLWSVGNSTVIGTQSVDISRGSVWQALLSIANNFNAYIIPRVTFSTAGAITGRYIDIVPAGGTFRGLLLSVDKNMQDPCVTYDDTDTLTALYGYGGSVDVAQSGGAQDTTEELTFKDVVWTATSGHPAKPSGQTYLEWPEKTALYGRNGRPRFGYYQNSNIKDAGVLLQKTWEALQRTCDPKVTVSGTVTDLYRLGYKNQPLRLHDTAYIEIRPTGEKLQLEIIKLYVDFLDPTQTRPEIGAYIPNIIYINRDTAKNARGGGGGGGRGQTNIEHEDGETYTEFVKTQEKIGMVVGTYNGGYKIEAGEITLAINETTGQSLAVIDADHVNISATNTVYTLAGALHIDANGKLIIDNAGGMYVQRTEQGITAQFGVWDKGNLTGGVMVQEINGTTETTIRADKINIAGIVTALQAYTLTVENIDAQQGQSVFSDIVVTNEISGDVVDVTTVDATTVDCANLIVVGYGDGAATWQSETIPTLTFSNRYNFVYRSNGVDYTALGYIVGSHGSKTIHYLGSATT